MRIILFGTVIRTRKSLERIIVDGIRSGQSNSKSINWAVNVYNTGILGLVFYRATHRQVGISHFAILAGKFDEN